MGEDRRAHTDGKFVDLHPRQLGGDEMSKLVDGNEDAEHENRNKNIEKHKTSKMF